MAESKTKTDPQVLFDRAVKRAREAGLDVFARSSYVDDEGVSHHKTH